MYQLSSIDKYGLTVVGPLGSFFIPWEQKEALTNAGILAVLPEPGKGHLYIVRILVGELPGMESDSDFPGVIRDPNVMALWRKERDHWMEPDEL